MPYSPPDPKETYDRWDEPRLHMERLFRAKLIEFDLSPRIVFPLADHGIVTLGDLINSNTTELSRIRNIGANSISVLLKFLSHHRLSFGMKKGQLV